MVYRYRTPVLVGAWFSSVHMARADAIRAGQARRDEDGSFSWRASATIETAQSEGAGLQPPGQHFVKYWLHGAHLLVEGKKMSKSLGNFFTLRDLLNKGYTGREIRYLMLKGHYRETFNFTLEGLEAARSAFDPLRITHFTGGGVNAAAPGDHHRVAATPRNEPERATARRHWPRPTRVGRR